VAEPIGVCYGQVAKNLPPDPESLGNDVATATAWVENNVPNYFPDVKFRYIAVGNEINPQDAEAKYVLSPMQNIKTAIASAHYRTKSKFQQPQTCLCWAALTHHQQAHLVRLQVHTYTLLLPSLQVMALFFLPMCTLISATLMTPNTSALAMPCFCWY
ncbi:unnamed protein product, partial [Prunus brigantina]